MASGDTKTEALLNILGNGGDASAYSGCCNTKTQNYILDAINRVQNVEDEVEELKNNPDVVDIVATYADLQAYDTQHLTDKDIIRVLQDETHDDESTYYRYNKQSDTWTYIGESKQYTDFVGTDGTTAGEAGLVPAPAATDAGKFLKADGTWDIAGGSGGGVTILTSADYNYHSSGDTDDGIAVWKLNRGYYKITDNGPIKVYWTSTISENVSSTIFIIGHTNYGGVTGKRQVIRAGAYSAIGTDVLGGFYIWTVTSNGTSSDYNTGNKNGYTITGSNITSIAGSSDNEIMSQNATTSMVFRDPSTMEKVQIGRNAWANGSNAIAIGGHSLSTYAPQANDSNAIAIGVGSKAYNKYSVSFGGTTTAQGEMNIETYGSANGYNNTNYRLLTGLHDPVGAHDAATKGYVDGKILSGAGAPTTSTVGTVGQVYQDTTNAKLYICTDATNPYVWTEVGAGGGSGPTVVQTTGTSTTDVMSQDAATKLVYVDSSSPNGISIGVQTTAQLGNFYGVAIGSGNYTLGSNNIAIGRDASAGNNANRADNIAIGREAVAAAGSHRIAIGNSAGVINDYSVALGAEAKTSRAGEVNVGTGSSSHGYNSTSYRVIGGVHDGQEAHDVVTVSQVNSVIDAINTALSTNIPHIGAQS